MIGKKAIKQPIRASAIGATATTTATKQAKTEANIAPIAPF